MPTLAWPTKSLADPEPAELFLDSLVYPCGHGYPDSLPENRLYLGDNLKVMAALLPEYEGRIDLIYADPPFFTNKRFPARIGRGEDSRRPQDWQLAEGYGDRWGTLDEYLDFLYPRLAMMVRLLAPPGSCSMNFSATSACSTRSSGPITVPRRSGGPSTANTIRSWHIPRAINTPSTPMPSASLTIQIR